MLGQNYSSCYIWKTLMTYEFKHPNYYKNLRKLARLRNRDQAISDNDPTGSSERAPGTGLKLQAPSTKLQAPSYKHQAPSDSSQELQASSPKQQASSSKPWVTSALIRDPWNIWKRFKALGPRASAMIKVLLGCVTWNAIWCGLNFNFLPLVTFNSTVKKWPLLL